MSFGIIEIYNMKSFLKKISFFDHSYPETGFVGNQVIFQTQRTNTFDERLNQELSCHAKLILSITNLEHDESIAGILRS